MSRPKRNITNRCGSFTAVWLLLSFTPQWHPASTHQNCWNCCHGVFLVETELGASYSRSIYICGGETQSPVCCSSPSLHCVILLSSVERTGHPQRPAKPVALSQMPVELRGAGLWAGPMRGCLAPHAKTSWSLFVTVWSETCTPAVLLLFLFTQSSMYWSCS